MHPLARRFLIGLGALALGLPAAWASSPEPALIPRPAEVRYGEGQLILRKEVRVVVAPGASARVAEIAEVLQAELATQLQLRASIVRTDAADPGDIVLALDRAAPDAPPAEEAYRLTVRDRATVSAHHPRGLLWGVQTLLQSMVRIDGQNVLRHVDIQDQPVRPWRALLLDPARSFQDLDFLQRTLRVMSGYKLNVLHLHLIDDQAWRFESEAFPRVNPPGEPRYTRDELRDLVAYAARYGIDVLPELDFPGHSRAQIAAYPELDCHGIVRPMDDAIMCAGKPFTWEFIEQVVAEAVAVFPFEYLHLGADEPFALRRWGECADCRRRMEDKGVASLDAFYHTVVTDLHEVVKRHGRKMMVWNDAIRPGVEPMPSREIAIDAWMRYANAAALAEAGYPLINSSYAPLYISSFGLREGLPLPAVRQWNATRFMTADPPLGAERVELRALPEAATILGGQVSAWASDQRVAERRLYPRTLAVADTLWAEGREGGSEDFAARFAAGHQERLARWGVPDDESLPRVRLLEGSELSAWERHGQASFSIEAGVLTFPRHNETGRLQTKDAFRDFILTFELQGGTPIEFLGLEIRADESGVGRRIELMPPPGIILMRALRALTGWNHYELTARGGVLSLTVNGCLAWSVPEPMTRAGPIVVRGARQPLQMRKMEVRVLADRASDLP